ncbi:hypothetical protein LTR95_008203 [Oleoguttula sp. CCFEE 5521]
MAAYAHLPPGLFRPGDEADALRQVCERLALQLDIQLLHRAEAKGSSGTTSHRCMLKVSIGDEKLHVVGEGKASKPESKDAAWTAMIAQLRDSGNLEDLDLKLRPKVRAVGPIARATQPPRHDSVSPLDRTSALSQAYPSVPTSAPMMIQSPGRSPSTPQPTFARDAVHTNNSASSTSSPATSLLASMSSPATPRPSPTLSTNTSTASSLQGNNTKRPTIPTIQLPTTYIAHRDAKYSVYNFVAKYGLVPDFSFKRTKESVRVQMTVGQSAVAVGFSCNVFLAEGAALLDFVRQVRSGSVSGLLPAAILSYPSCATAEELVKRHATSAVGSSVAVEFAEEVDRGTQIHWARVVIRAMGFTGPYAYSRRKIDAEVLAYLGAAVDISTGKPSAVRSRPDGVQSTQVSGQRTSAKTVEPVSKIDICTPLLAALNSSPASATARLLVMSADALQAEANDAAAAAATRMHNRRSQTSDDVAERSWILELEQEAYEDDPKLSTLHAQRSTLPVSKYRQELKGIVDSGIYSIVIGDTGSGKTTQVPQILLEEMIRDGTGAECNIICTQPRRIAATSVADRVTTERDEPLQVGVGYQVRFDTKLPRYGGSITYYTTGIFLQQLKHDADGVLESASHILIDEAHERDLNVDFLMVVVKNAVRSRQTKGLKVPRIVLMSATIDHTLFAKYLGSGVGTNIIPAPTIHIPGRTFPVTWRYLSDTMDELMKKNTRETQRLLALDARIGEWMTAETKHSEARLLRGVDQSGVYQAMPHDPREGFVPLPLLGAIIGWVCSTTKDGAVLVFLPGLAEITSLDDFLLQHQCFGEDFSNSRKYRICLLHSTVPKEEQAAVFERDRPGQRKIILATNIAETSITVTDVKYVIDAGKMREKQYDQTRRITQLRCVWESKSNARQRAGRAGRVQHGTYFALYSKERFEDMRAVGLPEMLRTDLSETVLAVKASVQGVAVQSFLAQAIEPPTPVAIEGAISNLKAMEALTATEELTDLGRVLSKLPVHPSLGKPILLGILYRCLDPMILFGAIGGEKGLFVAPREQRAEANARHRRYFTDRSEHMAFINAFSALRAAFKRGGVHTAFRIAKEDFLHFGAFKTCIQSAEQIEKILREAGLLPQATWSTRSLSLYGPDELNRNSSNSDLIKCLLLAGQPSNLAWKINNDGPVLRTATEGAVMLHPGSMNRKDKDGGQDTSYPKGTIFTYSSLNKASQGGALFIRETSQVTPLQATLFGGPLAMQGSANLLLNGWLVINPGEQTQGSVASKLLELRDALHAMHLRAFRSLGERKTGQVGFGEDKARDEVVGALVKVLAAQGD